MLKTMSLLHCNPVSTTISDASSCFSSICIEFYSHTCMGKSDILLHKSYVLDFEASVICKIIKSIN